MLERFLVDSSRMVTALAERRDDLAGLIGNLNTTTRALGSQKEALAESIGRLPAFMRRANTTFVDLRSTLDEVDPLVEASKPVAKRLQPFLSQARAFAADAEPTVRDLSITIRKPGGSNDLIDLLHSFPPLAEIATATKQRDYAPGGRSLRRGRDARRLPGVRRRPQGRRRRDRLRPPVHHRLPRLVRRLLDHGGGFDALGATARGMITASPVLHPDSLATKQYRRCPGAAEAPAKDGSNVLLRGRAVRRSTATESDRGVPRVRRVLVVIAVLGVCAGAFVLAGASDQSSQGTTYKIKFDNAFGLVEGGDFRVGGVNAGQTTDFEVEKKKGESPKAVVTVEVSKPGFGDFRKDASCEVRPQSLIGEYYVDCQPGKSDERLPDGGVVPVEQTASTIPTDIVNNIMRRPYRERFRLIVTELGTGLAGRPDDLQEVLRRAHPGLRETSKVLRILGDQNQVIKNFITDSDTVISELEKNKRDVVRWVREAGDAAEISATRRNELRAGFRRFPEFLDELRPTMARLGELADEQTPLLADLQRAAPDLDTFFTRLGPFSEASRPAVRSLGDAGEIGTKAFTEGTQEIAELRTLAAGAPALAQAAAPVPPDDRRPQARDRERPAREGQRAARAGPDRHPGRGRASPAWSRSGTTSTGRRSASTCWTTPRTCCARRSPSRRTARTGATSRRRRRRTRRRSSAATRTSARTSRASSVPIRSTTAPTRRPRSSAPTAASRHRASASSAARASPRPARCPASPTSRSRRSCSRPASRTSSMT